MCYSVTLNNGVKILLHIYLVFCTPEVSTGADHKNSYTWRVVSRACCKKGCQVSCNLLFKVAEQVAYVLQIRDDNNSSRQGQVLRSMKRFGKRKRPVNCSILPLTEQELLKDGASSRQPNPRQLYLSFDEARTHVGGHSFRLIAGAFDVTTRKLLGSCCSRKIRVLANNDMPSGKAFIDLCLPVRYRHTVVCTISCFGTLCSSHPVTQFKKL